VLVRQVLQQFGAVRLRAMGGSMLPAIRPGDILDIRHAALSIVVAGDIVLFERAGALFVHRVVRRDGRTLTTRGDAHWRADPPIDASQLLGTVTGLSRGESTVVTRPPRRGVAPGLVGALRRLACR
jgi:hypothetical protein